MGWLVMLILQGLILCICCETHYPQHVTILYVLKHMGIGVHYLLLNTNFFLASNKMTELNCLEWKVIILKRRFFTFLICSVSHIKMYSSWNEIMVLYQVFSRELSETCLLFPHMTSSEGSKNFRRRKMVLLKISAISTTCTTVPWTTLSVAGFRRVLCFCNSSADTINKGGAST